MFAPVVDEPTTAFANELSVSELVILEFDQWGHTDQPRVAPTSICYFEPDPR
jgi:hypothetical protein